MGRKVGLVPITMRREKPVRRQALTTRSPIFLPVLRLLQKDFH
jgi:hypothetical protein